MTQPPPPPDLPGRFAYIIAGLCRVVAAHIADDRTAAAWIRLVWARLSRTAQRFQRLAAQIQSGTVPPLRTGAKHTKPRKPVPRPPIVLAGKPGWLIHTVLKTAVYGSYLRQILDDPEMAALLAAAPQLARLLRPLCRALGVTPPPLPVRPAQPTPPPGESNAAPAADAPASPPPHPAARPKPARPRAQPVRTLSVLKSA